MDDGWVKSVDEEKAEVSLKPIGVEVNKRICRAEVVDGARGISRPNKR